MHEDFYKKMDEMFKKMNVNLQNTNDKTLIKSAENFSATFTPQKKSLIIK